MPTNDDRETAARIVDAAVTLAAQRSWEAIRLRDVAQHLGIGLDAIRTHFREKDDLIDAWFDRADDALLAAAGRGDIGLLSARERLFALIMAWLDALEPQRRVTRQMIQARLEPGHLHIQIPQLTRISRTVQWIREGAMLTDAGVRRAFTETATTAIYLAAFTRWMGEDTPGSPRTRRLLDRLLRGAERVAHLCPLAPAATTNGPPRPGAAPGTPDPPPAWTP